MLKNLKATSPNTKFIVLFCHCLNNFKHTIVEKNSKNTNIIL